jgi:hypothetical protein
LGLSGTGFIYFQAHVYKIPPNITVDSKFDGDGGGGGGGGGDDDDVASVRTTKIAATLTPIDAEE